MTEIIGTDHCPEAQLSLRQREFLGDLESKLKMALSKTDWAIVSAVRVFMFFIIKII